MSSYHGIDILRTTCFADLCRTTKCECEFKNGLDIKIVALFSMSMAMIHVDQITVWISYVPQSAGCFADLCRTIKFECEYGFECGLMEQPMQVDKQKVGVLVGTGMGGLTVFSDGVQALVEKGHKRITPFFIPYAITNMGSALLAIDLGLMGPNYSISTACATANYCFYAAANHIRRGEADMMIAGGTEAAILPIGLGGFVACRALSTRNDSPQTASRPWDKEREGFVMGEGAGVLVCTPAMCVAVSGIRSAKELLD